MQKFKWDKDHIDLSLLDEDFLIALQEQKNREVFARIATLDVNENPLEYIQGRVTDGSISVDGGSAVRRTCNLSLFAESVNINDVYWGLKTKFKLEIGLKNNLNGEYASSKEYLSYPEIVWFPQGTYVITSFNTAVSTKGYTISISGKDKMILLNGEIGGSLFASVDFGQEEVREIKLIEVTNKVETSETLLTRQHYYEITYDELRAIEGWTNNTSAAQQYIPSENSLRYIFVPDAKGEFFKLNDRYWHMGNSECGNYDYAENTNQWVREVQLVRSNEMLKGFSAFGQLPERHGLVNSAIAAAAELGTEGRYYFYTLDDDDYTANDIFLDDYTTTGGINLEGKFQIAWLDSSNFPLPWAEDGEHVLITTAMSNNGIRYEAQAKYIVSYYQLFKGTRYKAYKALQKPSELFIPIQKTNSNWVVNINNETQVITYEPDKYYFKRNLDDDEYFELNQTDAFKTVNYTNYKIRPFYSWNYEYTKKKVPLAKIIREALHAYGQEPYYNIVINDLDDYALEQLTYKGDSPLYAFRINDSSHNNYNFTQLAMNEQIVDQAYYEISNGSSKEYRTNLIRHVVQGAPINTNNVAYYTLNESTQEYVLTTSFNNSNTYYYFSDITGSPESIIEKSFKRENTIDNPNFQFDELSLLAPTGTTFKWLGYVGNVLQENDYTIAKIQYGQDVGYRITSLTYTGDLIANIGESLTSVLDKIKNMLGEFEYFYDVNGRFIFQKKRTYVNTAWSQLTATDDDLWVDYGNTDHKRITFSFEGNRLLTAVNNSPNLTNLCNDYVVWGKSKSTDGNEYPIHARYAIDKKPREYLAFDGILYYTEEAILLPTPEHAEQIGNNSPPGDPRNLSKYPSVLVEDGESDWWELRDWAEYYHSVTGAYPSQLFKAYSKEGFVGTLDFDDRTTQSFIGSGQLMIDFRKSKLPLSYPLYDTAYTDLETGAKRSMRWNPFQHTYRGCGHWFSQYQGFYQTYDDMITYIYKPELPEPQIINADGGQVKIQPKTMKLVDWRELIYQMATDYFAGQGADKNPIYNGFTGELVLDNPDQFLSAVGERNPYYYPTGYTGYEQYYTDIQGFWRQLYDPNYVPRLKYSQGYYTDNLVRDVSSIYHTSRKIWNDELIDELIIDYYVSSDNPDVQPIKEAVEELQNNRESMSEEDKEKSDAIINAWNKYYIDKDNDVSKLKYCYWNRNVFEDTAKLKFWLEFLDDANELAQFSVKAVGDRIKVVNEDKVKAIVYKEVPDIILYSTFAATEAKPGWEWSQAQFLQSAIGKESGYSYVFLPKGFDQYFSISYQSLSAKDKIDELLYQFGYCIENVTLTSIPIYQLQPNTRIYVRDEKTNINGEYIVSKFTIPLKHSGTMSITATKAPERLY